LLVNGRLLVLNAVAGSAAGDYVRLLLLLALLLAALALLQLALLLALALLVALMYSSAQVLIKSERDLLGLLQASLLLLPGEENSTC
jgi:hypothetical protein